MPVIGESLCDLLRMACKRSRGQLNQPCPWQNQLGLLAYLSLWDGKEVV